MDLGELGPGKAESLSIEWRWNYQLPSVLVWLPAAMLLLIIKANRNWRVATILLPVLVAKFIILPFILRLFFTSTIDHHYIFAFEVNSFVAGLTAFWLSMPVLCKIRWPLSCAFVFMLFLGLAAHFGNYGTSFLGFFFPGYMIYLAVPLLLAMFVSGIRCRKTYQPKRFLGWMLLWTILFAGLIGPPLFIAIQVLMQVIRTPADYSYLISRYLDIDIFLRMVPYYLLYGVMAYLINLLFMFWVIRFPYSHECFQKTLRLKQPEDNQNSTTTV
jgi:hypothetical protein